MSNKEREGSTKGKGGFYKKLQNYKTAKLVYYQMKYGLLLYFYDSQGYYGQREKGVKNMKGILLEVFLIGGI